tara:strand:- start:3 stop:800 length:798 start_codon:yes stop_codon:yes gene_type:complete
MSKVRAEQYTNRLGTGAPEIPFGVTLPEGASIDGAGGLNITGIATAGTIEATTASFSGNVSIGGTLTYEDVTNIDSIGIITARDDINIVRDNVTRIQLTHDGTDSFINNSTGHLYIRSNTGIDITNANGSKNMIVCTNAGEVEIFHNNVKKIETTSGGMKVTGNQTNNIVAMGANDVDCSAGSYFTKTITGATTFTFSNVPTGVEFSFTMEVTLNGSNAITWPSSVKWNADTAPALTDGKTQLFMFVTTNGGTRFRGSALVDYVN